MDFNETIRSLKNSRFNGCSNGMLIDSKIETVRALSTPVNFYLVVAGCIMGKWIIKSFLEV